LGGYTGTGKTELLHALRERGQRVVDLEAIAGHKGSAFGNIGLPPQPSQELFENKLALELITQSGEQHASIWLEDESQRIGLVNIPSELWKNMRKSPVYFLNIPFEERLKHIAEEYGQLDREQMTEAIIRIREKLGGQNAKEALELLFRGNTIESFRILLKYYDKYYFKSLHNRENVNSLLQRIDCSTVSPENANLLIHPVQSPAQKV
jgi:tRNA 2-selenouridine synthase